MDLDTIIPLLVTTLRYSTPLLLACLAGLFSERAGIFDIGLEGKMLMAAFFSATVAVYTTNPWLGMGAGILSAVALSLLHGLASINFRGNQLISGVAINFLAAGLTVLMANAWFGRGAQTDQIPTEGRFNPVTLPFAEALADVPLLGTIYADLISGHAVIVYIALACVPLTWWVLFRTRFGLRLRAVGEAPEAVDTAGVSVFGLRYAAVIICGVLCGIAGTYLSTALQSGFGQNMTADRGYIALAALIFAKWRPWAALGATLLFGFLFAVEIRFPDLSVLGWQVPGQFVTALPYIMTVVILAGFIGRAIPPRAGGEPYVKER